MVTWTLRALKALAKRFRGKRPANSIYQALKPQLCFVVSLFLGVPWTSSRSFCTEHIYCNVFIAVFEPSPFPPSLPPSPLRSLARERTYLFCAIRPEVTYHKYTFATLGFAKNASVVKLKPKMTTVKATPAEKKLMEELEQMKVHSSNTPSMDLLRWIGQGRAQFGCLL